MKHKPQTYIIYPFYLIFFYVRKVLVIILFLVVALLVRLLGPWLK